MLCKSAAGNWQTMSETGSARGCFLYPTVLALDFSLDRKKHHCLRTTWITWSLLISHDCQATIKHQLRHVQWCLNLFIFFFCHTRTCELCWCVSVVGCPDPTPPANAWMQRHKDRAVIKCNHTSETWYLTCRDHSWVGSVSNCTKSKSLTPCRWWIDHLYVVYSNMKSPGIKKDECKELIMKQHTHIYVLPL